jgi:hypothetical protein
MTIHEAIYKKMREKERSIYPTDHDPRYWIVISHEQRREIMSNPTVSYDMIRSLEDGTVVFMGYPLHVERKDLDMSGWLFYNSCIDVRNM